MKTIFTVFLFAITSSVFGQQTEDTLPIFVIVEESTQFPGGLEKFNEYVVSKLQHPSKKPKPRRIYVQLVVDTTGLIMPDKTTIGRPTNDALSEELHKHYDPQVIKAVNESPAWIPARQRGKKVRQTLVARISFNG